MQLPQAASTGPTAGCWAASATGCQATEAPKKAAHLDIELEPETEGPEEVVAVARLDGVREAHRLAVDRDLEAQRLKHVRGCGGLLNSGVHSC